MSELPEDPFSVLSQAATMLHELYESMVKAGFTPQQAMEIVLRTISQPQGPQ